MKKLVIIGGLLLAACATFAAGVPIGSNSVLVINAKFLGGSTAVTKTDLLNSAITNVNKFYTTNSYGLCTMKAIGSGSDYVVIELPQAKSYYNGKGYSSGSTELKNSATNAAGLAGYPSGNYNIVVIAFAECNNWFYWGYTLNSKHTLLNGHFSANVIIHEMGHTMASIDHSGSWDSNVADDPINDDAVKKTYGDQFDVMGMESVQYSGLGWGGGKDHFNCYSKKVAGWIASLDWVDVPTGTHTYKVFANDRLDSRSESRTNGGYLALRVTKGADARCYWIGVRQQYDASNTYLANGIQIFFQKNPMINDSRGDADTCLIDMTPLSQGRNADDYTHSADMNDSPLAVGQTFEDGVDNVTITAVDQGVSAQGVKWVNVQVTR